MSDPHLLATAVEVVQRTQKKLPRDIRILAETVQVIYEDAPDAELLKEGFGDDILGLFSGEPHGSSLDSHNPVPPQIFLYLDNLWDLADGDTPSFRDEVRITYLHELGHFLGWDEDELAARGLE